MDALQGGNYLRLVFSDRRRRSFNKMDSLEIDFMGEALVEAGKALSAGEVPVGCVIVSGDRVIGRGHNLRESRQDPTAHAEIMALRQAARELGSWRVSPSVCYVTLEPCPMCAGALVNARVDKLVYGCADPKAGAVETLYNLVSDSRLNHRIEVISGVRQEECSSLLTGFFQGLRQKRS